jgi:hypothetical protein
MADDRTGNQKQRRDRHSEDDHGATRRLQPFTPTFDRRRQPGPQPAAARRAQADQRYGHESEYGVEVARTLREEGKVDHREHNDDRQLDDDPISFAVIALDGHGLLTIRSIRLSDHPWKLSRNVPNE